MATHASMIISTIDAAPLRVDKFMVAAIEHIDANTITEIRLVIMVVIVQNKSFAVFRKSDTFRLFAPSIVVAIPIKRAMTIICNVFEFTKAPKKLLGKMSSRVSKRLTPSIVSVTAVPVTISENPLNSAWHNVKKNRKLTPMATRDVNA